jgi:predicted GTPase
LKSDLEIVVVDPMRAGHELSYHPGEMNLRRADIAVISKVSSAFAHDVDQVVANIREGNPHAVIVQTDTVISASDKSMIKGKAVLVVEDGPTLTHGGMVTGAGMEAARQFEADGVVNPRPYAQGEIADTYAAYPHLGPILPAVGYYRQQLRDLEATINAVPADVVVSATPFSLGTLLKLNKPLVQITYELVERGEPRLSDLVRSFLWKQGLAG